jgi:hypothetical protein
LVGLIGLGLLGGCGLGNSGSPAASYPDCPVGSTCAALAEPSGTVAAWFDAINARDVVAAKSLFEPSSADQTDWVATAPKNAFNDVGCREVGRPTSTTAAFHCTFEEAPGNWSGNRDTFWNIYLQKASSEKWLISGYGQG